MALSDRRNYKTIKSILNKGQASLSPSEKRDLLPYKKLQHKSSENLTNFEKFMKSKLTEASTGKEHHKSLRLNGRMSSLEKTLPIAANLDKFSSNFDTKRSEVKAAGVEELQRNMTNANAPAVKRQANKSVEIIGTMDSFFRSRSLGKLNRDIKKIRRKNKDSQNSIQDKSCEKVIKGECFPENKEAIEKINRLSHINNFHCLLNTQTFASPKHSTQESSRAISLNQIRRELGFNLTERNSDQTNNELSAKRNKVNNVIESYNVIKSVHANLPSKLIIPRGHLDRVIIRHEDPQSKETVELSKESISNAQTYEASILQGGVMTKDNILIDNQQSKKLQDETNEKSSDLSYIQSYRGCLSERGRISRANNVEKMYNHSKRSTAYSLGLINSDRAGSPALNSSKISNSKERMPIVQNDIKNMYLPEWLEQRKDFKKACREFSGQTKETIPVACMKPSYSRTLEEIESIATWLEKVKTFRMLPRPLIYSIVEKVKPRNYKRNQVLCYQGEPGDCLYIVFSGIVQCLVDGVPVAHYKAGDSIGQTSLDGTSLRTATLIATSAATIFRLEREDYRFIMEYYSMKQRGEFKGVVASVKGFEQMSDNKITLISLHLQSKYYTKGESIYHEDESAEALYILKQGSVIIESNISIEKENLWPAGKNVWEKCTLVRNKKVSHVISPYSCFGETELINNCNRINTAICGEDSHILILNKNDFSNLLDSNDINLLRMVSEEQIYEDVNKMKREIVEKENEKEKMKGVMMKALTGRLSLLNSHELKKRNPKIESAMEKVKQDFKSFLRQNTVKSIKRYEKVQSNIE